VGGWMTGGRKTESNSEVAGSVESNCRNCRKKKNEHDVNANP